jgi:DNA-binding GntR family transcriptional regulator
MATAITTDGLEATGRRLAEMADSLRARAADADEVVLPTLQAAILSGVLAPGTRLRQEDLAAVFGTSRVPIRQALRALEFEGLATSEAHRGFVVSSIDADEIEEIYELRILLESHAIRLAVPLLTYEDLDELEGLYQEMASAPGPDEQLAAREKFYRRLYSITARPRLSALIMRYRREVSRPLRWQLARHTPAHHEALWQAIKDGDADRATAELAAHYRRVSALLRRLLRSQAGSQTAGPAAGLTSAET